jgi:hypothetical protein
MRRRPGRAVTLGAAGGPPGHSLPPGGIDAECIDGEYTLSL